MNLETHTFVESKDTLSQIGKEAILGVKPPAITCSYLFSTDQQFRVLLNYFSTC